MKFAATVALQEANRTARVPERVLWTLRGGGAQWEEIYATDLWPRQIAKVMRRRFLLHDGRACLSEACGECLGRFEELGHL